MLPGPPKDKALGRQHAMKMTTPADILAQRAAARARGALSHTYNVDGHIKREVGCPCYECRDFFDPTGEEDAGRANAAVGGGVGAPGYLPRANAIPVSDWLQNPAPPVQGRGFLARADGVQPFMPSLSRAFPPQEEQRPQLARADGVRPEDSPLMRQLAAAAVPPPPSPPRLERQRAVCYDENGVDILAAGQRVAAALRSDRDRGSRFELGPEHAAIQPLRNLMAHYESQLRELRHQNIITARELESLQLKLAQTRDLLSRLDPGV